LRADPPFRYDVVTQYGIARRGETRRDRGSEKAHADDADRVHMHLLYDRTRGLPIDLVPLGLIGQRILVAKQLIDIFEITGVLPLQKRDPRAVSGLIDHDEVRPFSAAVSQTIVVNQSRRDA